MKNVLMILFLTFSFQVLAAEDGDNEDPDESATVTYGEHERCPDPKDCTCEVDSNRRSDASVSSDGELRRPDDGSAKSGTER